MISIGSGTYKAVANTKNLTYKNSKLTKGETYYYKVRAYKTVKGKKIYGSYSAVKSAKAK